MFNDISFILTILMLNYTYIRCHIQYFQITVSSAHPFGLPGLVRSFSTRRHTRSNKPCRLCILSCSRLRLWGLASSDSLCHSTAMRLLRMKSQLTREQMCTDAPCFNRREDTTFAPALIQRLSTSTHTHAGVVLVVVP